MHSASPRFFLVLTIACTSGCFLVHPAASWGQQFIAHGGPIPEVRLEAVGRADLPVQIQPPQEIPKQVVVLDGTPVKLQMVRTISSAHAQAGDRLDFVVVKDVTVGGFTVIQAGSIASGSVVGVRGKRILGIGGKIIIKLDSVTMVTGEHAVLRARKEIKGGSRTKLMLAEMLATGLSYLPAAPVFLLSRGCDSTVLKGMEVTAYISGNAQLSTLNLLAAKGDGSELSSMIHFLPPRTIDGEGRDGDMLNLVFVANQDDLEDAFARAGWIKTDKTRFPAFWHLAMQRMHYAKLPMRRLFVFGRTQDYSYALPDSASIVSKRHHLRIWKTDYQVDGTPIWVGAATYDVALQWQLRKLRIFHRIDPKVDSERDFIAGKLSETNLVTRQEYLHCANPVFKGETATGGPYYSDSRMLLVELRSEKSAKSTRQLALPAPENSAAANATLNATR
jgi:hypothetical protein